MDQVETAVGEWHRVYAQLSAARERLRRTELMPPDRRGQFGKLAREVARLEQREEQALRAVREALVASRQRGSRVPERPSWVDTEPA